MHQGEVTSNMTENYSVTSGRFRSATTWAPSPSQKNKPSVKRHNILNRGVLCGHARDPFVLWTGLRYKLWKFYLMLCTRLGREQALDKQIMKNGGEREGRRERNFKK